MTSAPFKLNTNGSFKIGLFLDNLFELNLNSVSILSCDKDSKFLKIFKDKV